MSDDSWHEEPGVYRAQVMHLLEVHGEELREEIGFTDCVEVKGSRQVALYAGPELVALATLSGPYADARLVVDPVVGLAREDRTH